MVSLFYFSLLMVSGARVVRLHQLLEGHGLSPRFAPEETKGFGHVCLYAVRHTWVPRWRVLP